MEDSRPQIAAQRTQIHKQRNRNIPMCTALAQSATLKEAVHLPTWPGPNSAGRNTHQYRLPLSQSPNDVCHQQRYLPGTADITQDATDFNLLKPRDYFTCHQVYYSKILNGIHIVLMCFVLISEQTATFALYISRLVLYNRGGKCLQRGTDWVLT